MVRAHHTERRGEAEATTREVRREERIERAGRCLRRHPLPGVLDGEDDEHAGKRCVVRKAGEFMRSERLRVDANGDRPAAFAVCLARIGDDSAERLAKVGDVTDERLLGLDRREYDVDGAALELVQLADHVHSSDLAFDIRALPGSEQHRPREPTGLPSGPLDVVEALARAVRDLAAQQLGLADDRLQEIVELVGDASRHDVERFEPRRLLLGRRELEARPRALLLALALDLEGLAHEVELRGDRRELGRAADGHGGIEIALRDPRDGMLERARRTDDEATELDRRDDHAARAQA